jgi:prepilin-type processing-associated H-X9-DG protein
MGGGRAREAARRTQCMNNLKQIALAIRFYEAEHHELPPAYTTDADGKPLHSWRTLILPYMEEQELYDTIDLTKPWDDPVNAEAIKRIPLTYQCPSVYNNDNRTTYLAVVSPSSCLRGAEPRKLSEVTDPAATTLVVIEVDEAHGVPWMAPEDADETLLLTIGVPNSKTPHPAGMNAAFVDGHVEFLSADTPRDQRLALVSIAGNDNTAGEVAN